MSSRSLRPCCIVVGAGGHARAVVAVLQETNQDWSCSAVIDVHASDSALGAEESIIGIGVENGIHRLQEHFERGTKSAFIAFGDAAERRHWLIHCRQLGFNTPNLISLDAYLAPEASLGSANFLGPRTFLGPQCTIGSNNILNTAAVIEHEVTIGDDCHLAPGSIVAGRTTIGSRVFLGLGSRVIDRLTVCDDVIVGAGGVVVRDIQQSGLYVGVPAAKCR